jgi:hypothetical protein
MALILFIRGKKACKQLLPIFCHFDKILITEGMRVPGLEPGAVL